MKYTDEKITSIQDLMTVLPTQVSPDETIWFRGQAVASWSLMPTMFRPPYAPFSSTKELESIKRFKQNALRNLTDGRPTSEAEWVFLMRHHGVPTRLIDWTESPLAALYFALATDAVRHKSDDAAVWCLLPLSLNGEAGVHSIPAFDDLTDNNLESYLPARVGLSPLVDPLAAIGVRNSARMYAQQGIFTISHRKEMPIEEVGAKNHVWRFVIPAAAKDHVLGQLRTLRITRLTLFPELDSVAALATEALQ